MSIRIDNSTDVGVLPLQSNIFRRISDVSLISSLYTPLVPDIVIPDMMREPPDDDSTRDIDPAVLMAGMVRFTRFEIVLWVASLRYRYTIWPYCAALTI